MMTVEQCRGQQLKQYNPQAKQLPISGQITSPPSAPGGGLTTKDSNRDCIWIEDDDGIYNTSCGNAFEVMDGTPEFNNMKFCPYCGKSAKSNSIVQTEPAHFLNQSMNALHITASITKVNMTDYCIICKHCLTHIITTYWRKLNSVMRRLTDTCCWDTKKYPSKYEPQEKLPEKPAQCLCETCRMTVEQCRGQQLKQYNPQAEREKVLELLNDLRKYANGEYKEADLSDNEHDMRIHLEYGNRIMEIGFRV
jgi:hypothetical protein